MIFMVGYKYFSMTLRGMHTDSSPRGAKCSLSSTGIFKSISARACEASWIEGGL
jgi:hypothetical protein